MDMTLNQFKSLTCFALFNEGCYYICISCFLPLLSNPIRFSSALLFCSMARMRACVVHQTQTCNLNLSFWKEENRCCCCFSLLFFISVLRWKRAKKHTSTLVPFMLLWLKALRVKIPSLTRLYFNSFKAYEQEERILRLFFFLVRKENFFRVL